MSNKLKIYKESVRDDRIELYLRLIEDRRYTRLVLVDKEGVTYKLLGKFWEGRFIRYKNAKPDYDIYKCGDLEFDIEGRMVID